ncbi:hypothetical protein HMPREF9318_02037 [Streptococcus urinalis FB127-CNA-2]|uniref:Iron chelate uptake ABC transporter, FeCT family, permease protein n=1 Tax=Streptococcus urinalis 2285-97 TaxID=764291 RepID=G5KCK0_9STRE|nr:iron ABC transporter permease [Streptococcus urinalis]EHJ56229.1 iron chelate uptake ABC transporter, FeCT family, permease protein [Streptococcus urinalis 2285-97]EKS17160.1 hypothetical protein HMPREF9318_02037 [Streptococcus urinalis FB127-CNA-2]VEF32590.1 iron chelate uptake ABC transporter, FeCT family, permease protein [Streptococcus urinalis]
MIFEKTQKRVLLILIISLVFVFLISLAIGQSSFSIQDLIDVLFGNSNNAMIFIITKIRLPRLLAASIGGASLALSGLLLQTLTKNPLADSGVLGINTGAGMIITLVITFSQIDSPKMIQWLPFLSAVGGCLTILFVYFMSRKKNHGMNPVRLIITGVGVSTLLSGLMVSLIGNVNQYKMDYIVNWLSGRISGDDWQTLIIICPILLIFWLLSFSRSRFLNIMNLNDETALALGLDLQKERLILLILATILSAISVILVGNITFLGLVSGHITRQILGNDHRITIPCSLMIGAMILLIADSLCRVLLVGTDIPTGILVSVIGAPYFIYLLTKMSVKST